MTLTGGCLCGKVRFGIEGKPLFVSVCHCKNCQKQSGAAYSVNVGVPDSALTVTGTLKTYVDHGDSGKEVRRRFCPECGSPLISDAEAYPGIHILKAGTFDDPSGLKPSRQIFCASKQPWVPILENVPASERAP